MTHSTRFTEPNANRFSLAIAAFDSYHRNDPNKEVESGEVYPAELLYAERMTRTLSRFAPEADESVKLAARCQHIGRWEIPREKYPMDRKGYLQWRNEEKIRHSRIAESILIQCGYDDQTIAKVKLLLLKKELHSDADVQLLEDVACLVFIEYYLSVFAEKHDDPKLVDILRKTLKKMSRAASAVVDEIHVPARIRTLLGMAESGV